VQENVYEILESYSATSKFEHDVSILMRECLVGTQITPRGNSADESKLSNPLNAAGARLKNFKTSF